MTTRDRRHWSSVGLVPGVLVLLVALVVSACTPQQPPNSRPSQTGQTPGASPTAGKPAEQRTVQPVAGFDPKQHALWNWGVTSPNRAPMTSSAMPPGMSKSPAGTTMQTYLQQKITWAECGRFQCGTVQVPLNWDDPSGLRITLKMLKVAATGAKKGTLFINPGGPGGSGQDYARGFDNSSLPGYDVIGWDPRGSGESTPVVCWSDKEEDQAQGIDATPDSSAEWIVMTGTARERAQACRAKSGALLDHISTIDNVRDLDYLRHLVGDKKLTYLGVSYGTYVGSMYAELYPDRAGRLVLDSAVNITANTSVIQQMGFDLALKNFATWCAEQECRLGSSQAEIIGGITAFWTKLDTQPLQVGDRQLTQAAGVGGVAAFLYSGAEGYAALYAALGAAMLLHRGDLLLTASDFMTGRDDKGHYDPIAYAFPAIACADNVDGGVLAAPAGWRSAQQKAPIFGTFFGPGITCEVWTAKPSQQIKITADGAPPILVLGVTGDPATPYQQAVWMAAQLSSGVLLTWNGAGHSAYSLGPACITDKVQAFLNNGTVPPDKTTCG